MTARKIRRPETSICATHGNAIALARWYYDSPTQIHIEIVLHYKTPPMPNPAKLSTVALNDAKTALEKLATILAERALTV
jgi:hypothetical protein